jgi:hypothetical protein
MRIVLATVVSKGKMCILTNVDKATADDFCDERKELTSLTMLKISEHVDYINKGDRILIAIQLLKEHEK